MGIRKEESTWRAKRKRIDEVKKWIIYKPIFYWLEWQIWEYIEDNNLEYCSLYDEGFDRLGCVVCPFLSYVKHQRNRKRWPKYYCAFEKAMQKLWDSKEKDRQIEKGYAYTFEEFLDNWYRGKEHYWKYKKYKKRKSFGLLEV